MDKLVKLPPAIALAIALYYINSNKQYTIKSHYKEDMPPLTVVRSKYTWDKTADLERLGAACKRLGWGCSASAGTFWLKKNKFIYTVDEETFPLASKQKSMNA